MNFNYGFVNEAEVSFVDVGFKKKEIPNPSV